MIENSDYFVKLIDFPTCASGGVVILNDDGTYTVLLNARLSHEQNMKSMDHELNHMLHDDLYREDVPLDQIEEEAG